MNKPTFRLRHAWALLRLVLPILAVGAAIVVPILTIVADVAATLKNKVESSQQAAQSIQQFMQSIGHVYWSSPITAAFMGCCLGAIASWRDTKSAKPGCAINAYRQDFFYCSAARGSWKREARVHKNGKVVARLPYVVRHKGLHFLVVAHLGLILTNLLLILRSTKLQKRLFCSNYSINNHAKSI